MSKRILALDMPDNLRQFALDHPAWVRFQSKAANADIFHLPAWTNLLAECYGFKPYALGVIAGAGQKETIVVGIPFLEVNSLLTGKRIIALPFSDFCQPLGDATPALVQALQSWRKARRSQQLVIHWPLPAGDGVYQEEPFARHITALYPEPEKVFNNFKPKVKRFIHQAQEAGIVIRIGTTRDDLFTFYRLHLQTRKRQGTPIQPLRFFKLLNKMIFSQEMGFIMTAYKDHHPIAAAVFLHFNNTMTYKYGASDPAFWGLRPNHLLFWDAIQWGCKHGYQIFDWGRTDLDNRGLRDFKLGWGSEEQILHYSVLADKPPFDNLTGGTKQLVLAKVIQNSPAWVCRLIGELFYKYAA